MDTPRIAQMFESFWGPYQSLGLPENSGALFLPAKKTGREAPFDFVPHQASERSRLRARAESMAKSVCS